MEDQDKVWNLHFTILWAVLIGALHMATQTAVACYLIVTRAKFSLQTALHVFRVTKYNGFVFSWCVVVSAIIGALATIAVIKLRNNSDLRVYLAVQLPTWRQFGGWFAGVAALLALPVLSVLSGGEIAPNFMMRTYASLHSHWIFWFAALCAAPVFEEMFFRGFLISGLLPTVSGYGAVILSSVAWAVMHLQYDWHGLVAIFILGLILGAARVATGSLVLTTILHSFFNFVVLVLTIVRIHRVFA